MQVTFIQTSDALFYYPMLLETSKTVREFCIRNGISYQQFVGTKRGHMPWHSTYNRIYMLKEMLDRGYEGWVFYLDADAYVFDLDFDLCAYLSDKGKYGGIFAGYINNVMYDINAGGFAVNLSHPAGKGLVIDYFNAVEAIADADFDRSIYWDGEIRNDQHLLMVILEDYARTIDLASTFLFERTNQSHVNNGPFIRQHLRTMHADFATRVSSITQDVAAVMHGARPHFADGPGIYIPASHPRVLAGVGDKGPFGIASRGETGGLIYGPYMRLAAGDYIVRIYGETGASKTKFISDVCAVRGEKALARSKFVLPARSRGVLAEHHISLEDDVQDLEVRLFDHGSVDLRVHAVQLMKVSGATPHLA